MAEVTRKVQRFTSGEDLPVDPARIEVELASLWEAASERPERAGPVGRACHWNVVAWTQTDEEEARAKETITEASMRLPMRGIVIQADPSQDRPLKAWISANCHIAPDGGKLVCSEEVTISAGGRETRHLPSLVTALVLPDLPGVLWWLPDGPPSEGPVDRLLEGLDRIVVDSSSIADLEATFDRAGAEGREVAVGDLQWQRLRPWRVAISEAERAFGGPIGELRRIEIDRAPAADGRARLLAGWLVAHRNEGAPPPVGFRETAAATGETGKGIARVRLEWEGVRVEIAGERDALRIEATGGAPARRVPRGDTSLATLFHRELLVVWSDGRLRGALRAAPRGRPGEAP